MSFDPAAEGFAWPTATDVVNTSGASMRVVPYAIRTSGIAVAKSLREKECYRFYETPIGVLTELEINYWRAGGMAAVREFVSSFDAVFSGSPEPRPVAEVISSLLQAGLPRVLIEVSLGWLIKGNYVGFDWDRMLIQRK